MNLSPYNSTHITESDNLTSAQETSKTTREAGRSKFTQRDQQYRGPTEDTESPWEKRQLIPTAPPIKYSSEQNLRDSATSSIIHCNPMNGRASLEELNIPGKFPPKQRFHQQVVKTLSKNEHPHPANKPPYPTDIPPYSGANPSSIPFYSVTKSGNAIGWAVDSGPPQGTLGRAYDLGSSAEPPNPKRHSRNVSPYPTNKPPHTAKSAPYPVTGPPYSLPYPVIESDSAVSWSANSGLSMSKISRAYDSGSSAEPQASTRRAGNGPPFSVNVPPYPMNSPPYPVTELPDPWSKKLLPISPENSGRSQLPLLIQPESHACSTSAPASLIHNLTQTYRTQDSNGNSDRNGRKICICICAGFVLFMIFVIGFIIKTHEIWSNVSYHDGRTNRF